MSVTSEQEPARAAGAAASPGLPDAQQVGVAFVLWTLVDLIVGGIFLYAGLLKAIDPLQFASDIENYKILPWTVGVRLAFFLPWLEIFCGLALLTRRFYNGAVAILTGLVGVFIIASISAKARGIDITCGCFGHASKNLNFFWHMALIVILLGALIALWKNAPAATTVEPINPEVPQSGAAS